MSRLVAEKHGHPGLIVCGERAHTVAEMSRDQLGILREALCRVPIGPSSMLSLQGGRQVPVIQGCERLDVALEQAVDQPVIEIQTTAVDGAVAVRLHPRPGNGKAIPLNAQCRDQVEIRLEPVVVVTGDLAVRAVRGRTGAQAEFVPDRWPLAVGARRPFDLEGAARDTPSEIVWKKN